jgi:translation initiation factor 1
MLHHGGLSTRSGPAISISMTDRRDKTVLFLCTGNYYRSRYAEVLFNSLAAKWGLPWRATSRALALELGFRNVGPMAPAAVAALAAAGIRGGEAITRMPAAVTATDLESAERVIALKRDEHLPLVEERHPSWSARIEYWHIDDAPGVLPAIEAELHRLIARLLGGGGEAPPEPEPPPRKEPAKKAITLKVGRETAGRRGKGVTTIFDIPLADDALKELAATLKQKCGVGGTAKDGRIEIQGDQRERIVSVLESLGYKVKRVGG